MKQSDEGNQDLAEFKKRPKAKAVKKIHEANDPNLSIIEKINKRVRLRRRKKSSNDGGLAVLKGGNEQELKDFLSNNAYVRVPDEDRVGLTMVGEAEISSKKDLGSSSTRQKASTNKDNTGFSLSKLSKMLPSVSKDKPLPKAPDHKLRSKKGNNVTTKRNKKGVMV